MLTELYRQLMALLAEAGLTGYAEDCVPDRAALPWVTCRVEAPMSIHGMGSVTLTGWVRSDTAQADRLEMTDKLTALAPSGGRLLAEGRAALLRTDDAIGWPEGPGALGVRVRFGLRMLGGFDQ